MEHTRTPVRNIGISHDESRRKREGQTLSLRKQARDELLSKRRRGQDDMSSVSSSINPAELNQMVSFCDLSSNLGLLIFLDRFNITLL